MECRVRFLVEVEPLSPRVQIEESQLMRSDNHGDLYKTPSIWLGDLRNLLVGCLGKLGRDRRLDNLLTAQSRSLVSVGDEEIPLVADIVEKADRSFPEP